MNSNQYTLLSSNFVSFFGPAYRNFQNGSPEINTSGSIDVVDTNQGRIDSFIKELQGRGFVVTKNKSFRANTYRKINYSVYGGPAGEGINPFVINAFHPQLGKTVSDVVNAKYSADVNRLFGALHKFLLSKTEKKYTLFPGASKEEIAELKASGFSQLNTPQFWEMAKVDATSAAYRVAATQITKGIKTALLAVMEKQGADSEKIQVFTDLLDTEFGSAIVSMAIGMALTYTPKISDDARVQTLATEFRTAGIATAGNAAIESAIEYFLPVVLNAISSIPKEDISSRIEEKNIEDEEEEMENLEEEEKTELKKMSA